MLSFSKFDPRKLERQRRSRGPPTILFIGPRGTGKSIACKDILYYLRRIPTGTVFSETTAGVLDFKKIFPGPFVHNSLKLDKITKIIEHQTEKSMKSPDRLDRLQDVDTLVLLEDCMADKTIYKKKEFRNIFMNGRHLGICFVMNLQYMLDIPPALRTNVDYVFVTKETTHANKRKLYEYFFGCISTYKKFDEIFTTLTNNYGLMVIDKTEISGDLEKTIFWYKAELPPRAFLFGSKSFWKLGEKLLLNKKKIDIEKRKKKLKQIN